MTLLNPRTFLDFFSGIAMLEIQPRKHLVSLVYPKFLYYNCFCAHDPNISNSHWGLKQFGWLAIRRIRVFTSKFSYYEDLVGYLNLGD